MAGASHPDRLLVFLKAPRPGYAKTRLIPLLGPEGAAEAHRRLCTATLERLSSLPQGEIWYAPDDAGPEIAGLVPPGWAMHPQGVGDLGARLCRGLDHAFRTGARSAVAVGTDCPSIDAGDVREAWRRLATHDAVLGPATDGGYWLIGLARPEPRLFTGVEWGTGTVLAQTLGLANECGLRASLLAERSDVDTPEDWRRYFGYLPFNRSDFE